MELKGTLTGDTRDTLFRHLLNSDLPPSELSEERLSREAQVLIGAGTMTTAGTLAFLCYYILADPAIKERLTTDLTDVMTGYPDKKPTWAELEKVEYLQALIKEGLRYLILSPPML
ncbi:Trichodiene oxygenase [Beauveria bassiana]|uniref:Trichodiene oxygenase n=1 Tax=Beauveria bassiana TaxID=176275 RepID=A0A2N6NAX7_BEABA|nr:Trichodiene oxygenase [Beauveria bassiana]